MSPSKPEVRAQKWYLGVRIWNVQITMAIEFTKGQVCGNQLCKWLSVLGKLYTQIGQLSFGLGNGRFFWKYLLGWPFICLEELMILDPKKKKKCVSEKNRRLSPCEQLILGIRFLQISSWLAPSLPLCWLTGPFLSSHPWVLHLTLTLHPDPDLPLPSSWSSPSHLPPNTLHTYFSLLSTALEVRNPR